MRFYRCPMARFFKGKKWTHFDDSKYKHKLHISKSWQNGWQITTFFSLRVSLESEWTVKSSNTRQVPKIKFLWAVTLFPKSQQIHLQSCFENKVGGYVKQLESIYHAGGFCGKETPVTDFAIPSRKIKGYQKKDKQCINSNMPDPQSFRKKYCGFCRKTWAGLNIFEYSSINRMS